MKQTCLVKRYMSGVYKSKTALQTFIYVLRSSSCITIYMCVHMHTYIY